MVCSLLSHLRHAAFAINRGGYPYLSIALFAPATGYLTTGYLRPISPRRLAPVATTSHNNIAIFCAFQPLQRIHLSTLVGIAIHSISFSIG